LVSLHVKIVSVVFAIIVLIIVPTDMLTSQEFGKRFVETLGKQELGHLVKGKSGPRVGKFLANNVDVLNFGKSAYASSMFRFNDYFLDVFDVGGVRKGRKDWLFRRVNCTPWTKSQTDKLLDVVSRNLISIANSVNASGAKLLIAIVPNKASVYPEYAFPGRVMPAPRRWFVDRLVKTVKESGVNIFSLKSAFKNAKEKGVSIFYKDDHHYSFFGGQVTAKAIAAQIRAISGLKPVYQVPPLVVKWGKAKMHYGSLLMNLTDRVPVQGCFRAKGRFTRVSGRCGERYWDEQLQAYFNIKTGVVGPNHIHHKGIIMATSSFGYYGTPEFLANELQVPVKRFVKSGRSSYFPIYRYISQLSNFEKRAKPALVVWEIPEYHILPSVIKTGRLVSDAVAPKMVQNDLWKRIGFELTDIINADAVGTAQLIAKKPVVKFSIKMPEKSTQFRLIMGSSHKSGLFFITNVDNDEQRYYFYDNPLPATYDFELGDSAKSLNIIIENLVKGTHLKVFQLKTRLFNR
jgi:hypothetical protein